MIMESLKLLTLFSFFSMSISFAQAPANDECANRETITIGTTSFEQYSVVMTDATESLDASCENAVDTNKDVWYEFVMPIDGILFISNLSVSNYVTLYDSCGGAEIACGNDDTSFSGLTSGTTYVLRLSNRFNGTTSFRVQAFDVAANDECVNRETISVVTSNYTQYTIDSRTATESLDASCDVSTNNNLDLWYEFVMPVNGNVEISGVQFTRQTYTIYNSCGGTELQCLYENGFFMNLTAGTTYILRMSERELEAGLDDFRIQAFEFLANNDCVNSQTITVETANSNDYAINLKAAYESTDSSCETETNENFDLWYDLVMPVNGNLSLKQLSTEKATLYDACAGNEISCKTGAQFIYGLTSGVSYKLRISSTTPVTPTLRIQAFEEAPNDECSNSELLTVETADYIQYTIDTRTATESIDTSCENAINDNLDLWYEFTMPVSGNLQVSNVSNQFISTLFDVCSGVEIDCFNGSDSFLNLAFGTTYKLRVAQKFNDANLINMRLQAFEFIFNDECTNTQAIKVETDVIHAYGANVAAATESGISTCEPDGGDAFNVLDVWYSFTMPINGDAQINDLTGSSTQYFSLYETCGAEDIQCFTNDGMFTNLTSGSSYQLKVSMLSTSGSGVFNFSIQAKDSSLSFEDNELETLSIFPNPIRNTITISNRNHLQIDSISIYDLSGRKIKNINVSSINREEVVDISELQNAMYLLVISREKGEITKRIIKE